MESTSGPAPAPGGGEAADAPSAPGYGQGPPPGSAPGQAPPPGAAYGAPPPGAPAAAAPPTGPGSAESARNVATLAHLSALVGLLGIPMVVGPLVVWLSKRHEHPFVDDQGKEALNFNLSVLIYSVAAGVLSFFLTIVTFFLALFLIIPVFLAAFFGWIALVIVAAVKSSRGEPYRYPLTIRMVR